MHQLPKQLRAELRCVWRFRWVAMSTAWVVCLFGWTVVLSTLLGTYRAGSFWQVSLLAVVLIVGFGAGGIAALILNRRNRVFFDSEALRLETGRPVLGVVNLAADHVDSNLRRIEILLYGLALMCLLVLFVALTMLRDQIGQIIRTMF